jgi:dienelactone hydrolase
VVAALAHPYSTGVVAFADGRVLQANELGSDVLVQASDEAAITTAEAAISAVWAADMRFVLEKLPELSAMLSGAIDTERIGLLGHSFGGIALHQALAAEPRFLAGINLDGRGLATPLTFSQPYLFLMSDVPAMSAEQMQALGTNQQELEAAYQNTLTATLPLVEASSEGYALTLLNSAHNTFTTDWTLLPPLYSFAITDALVGSIDGAVAYETIRQTCLQFFEATLNGESYTPEQNPAIRVNYP